MTREECFGHCLSLDMKYASMLNTGCSCGADGADYAIYGQFADEKCYYRCAGNYEQYCGGQNAEVTDLLAANFTFYISIFELQSKYGK